MTTSESAWHGQESDDIPNAAAATAADDDLMMTIIMLFFDKFAVRQQRHRRPQQQPEIVCDMCSGASECLGWLESTAVETL